MLDWTARRALWEERVQAMGTRAVFNNRRGPEALAEITKIQQDTILPLFRQHLLDKQELLTLDFGCGYGRWTPLLAQATGYWAVGIDICPALLAEAERQNSSPFVEYRLYSEGNIPLETGEADVIWACLVLSTILDDDMLLATAQEFKRVLRPGGLLFITDNTLGPGGRPIFGRWSRSRTAEEYQKAFKSVADLQVIGAYFDLDEKNEILAGRKTS
jgi:SAM-dependent methyltransferase